MLFFIPIKYIFLQACVFCFFLICCELSWFTIPHNKVKSWLPQSLFLTLVHKANLVTNTKHKFPCASWSKDVLISLAYVRCQTSMLDMDCLVEENLAWCYSSKSWLTSLCHPFWGVVAWHTCDSLETERRYLSSEFLTFKFAWRSHFL